MNETIKRRLNDKNMKLWGKPDVVLIDGGKGQLDAAIKARNELGHEKLTFIGLAKREEQIVIKKTESNVVLDAKVLKNLRGYADETAEYILISLPHTTHAVKLLQRIRDESHRFAVSYHSTLKKNRQTKSILDEIPGVGPATKKKLLRHFGSTNGIKNAQLSELEALTSFRLARIIKEHIK